MSKFGLLSNLEEEVESPKQKFQVFEAELGFEKVEFLIPFENADQFIDTAEQQQPKSSASLRKLVAKFGGEIKK